MNRGGAENAIMNYYRHIDRRKVQFDFLLTESRKCHFEDEIRSLGGKVFRVPLLRLSNPWPYLKAVSSFFNNHQEYKIVHSHTSSKSFFPLCIAKMKGIPVRIAHSHNTRSETGYRGWIRDTLKIVLKRVANHYFACGEEAAVWLYGEKYVNEGNVRILPNVIECQKFGFDDNIRSHIRTKLSVNDETLIVGCVARFSPQKNLLFAIDVFCRVNEIDRNSKLILVGDGEERIQIESRILRLGLSDRIILTGVVSNVSDYEQAMDVFLMPSLFEGLPLSLIEAQISGLRCFVSTGIPEEVDKTGLVSFLPLEDGAKKWADLIIANKNYERRSHVEELKEVGYDAETSAEKLQNFYLNVLD